MQKSRAKCIFEHFAITYPLHLIEWVNLYHLSRPEGEAAHDRETFNHCLNRVCIIRHQ